MNWIFLLLYLWQDRIITPCFQADQLTPTYPKAYPNSCRHLQPLWDFVYHHRLGISVSPVFLITGTHAYMWPPTPIWWHGNHVTYHLLGDPSTQCSGSKKMWQPYCAGIVFLYSPPVYFIIYTLFYGHSLSFSPHPMFLWNYMCSPTLSFFVCTIIFVLRIGLLVLYKYWPTPTCIFFSLIIISLCWLHSPTSLEKHSTLSSLGLNTESLFSVTRPWETPTLLLRTSQNLSCIWILSP